MFLKVNCINVVGPAYCFGQARLCLQIRLFCFVVCFSMLKYGFGSSVSKPVHTHLIKLHQIGKQNDITSFMAI